MKPLHLPDVSEFQPDVTWAEVRKFNGGAGIIRALYGTGHVDRLWAAGRRASAHEHGVKTLGIYQYLVAGEDALAQAKAFVSAVGHLEPGEFAVLDLEEGTGDQSHRAKTWFDHVDAHLTYPGYHGTWLYSNASMLNSELGEFLHRSNRPIWVAQYEPLNKTPSVSRHTLWQHTDGKIAVPPDWHERGFPGVGHCDCSVFAGTLDELRAHVHS
jgi:GH25 family lysozyme M1 (1,4-beta-N-acetylmuramidase)